MVKITIPKSFGYPTAVFIVNHKRHVLQTGVEIEVDDAIAEVVNNAIALKPKKDPEAGKLSHDDLENLPFWEEVVESDTLTWDEVDLAKRLEEGDPSLTIVLDTFIKVSDTAVSFADVANGLKVCINSDQFYVDAEMINNFGMGIAIIETSIGVRPFAASFIPEEAVGVDLGDGIMFPEAGVYVTPIGSDVLSLTIPNKKFKNTVIKKIDEKYLPKQPHLYAHYFSIVPSSSSGASGMAHIFLYSSIDDTDASVHSLRFLIPSTVTAPKYYPVTGWLISNNTQYAIVGIQSMSSDPTNATLYLKYINPSATTPMVGSFGISDASVGTHECHQIF